MALWKERFLHVVNICKFLKIEHKDVFFVYFNLLNSHCQLDYRELVYPSIVKNL